MTIPSTLLAPILALIIWTLIVWVWMYSTRLPAMQKAKIKPQQAAHPGSLDALPASVRQVADNYNHLHEQPTIFYALCLVCHLAGPADGLQAGLAWGYVASRIVHSLLQGTVNIVAARFALFVAGTLILMVMAGRAFGAVVL